MDVVVVGVMLVVVAAMLGVNGVVCGPVDAQHRRGFLCALLVGMRGRVARL